MNRNMQTCFREHPDIYGSELDEDELAGEIEGEQAAAGAEATSASPSATKGEKVSDGPDHPAEVQGKRERAQAATQQVKADHGEHTSESDAVVPKAWHDSK